MGYFQLGFTNGANSQLSSAHLAAGSMLRLDNRVLLGAMIHQRSHPVVLRTLSSTSAYIAKVPGLAHCGAHVLTIKPDLQHTRALKNSCLADVWVLHAVSGDHGCGFSVSWGSVHTLGCPLEWGETLTLKRTLQECCQGCQQVSLGRDHGGLSAGPHGQKTPEMEEGARPCCNRK